MDHTTGMFGDRIRRDVGTPARGIKSFALVAAGVFLLATASPALAKTTIKILSPTNGSTVSQNVSVKYAYHKEGRANHVHVFVDGNFLKATKADPINLNLEKGHHTIMLRAASAHHDLLNARASVDVDVK